MVAEERHGAAAGVLGLSLEGHEQVEHCPDVFAAIGEVAGLHEGVTPAGPRAGRIGDACLLQYVPDAFDAAVDVAHRNEAPLRLALSEQRPLRVEGDDEGDGDEKCGDRARHVVS